MEAAIVNCPHDGVIMEYGVKDITVKYKGLSKTVQMPGWYCPQCGEGIHIGKDLKITDRALNELKSQYEGLLCANDIRRIRKKLHLTQKDAGIIIGGGPRAFQKYESGELLPSRAIVSALKLLDSNPNGLQLLERSSEELRTAPACA
jgi:HTH-type transcriptional regulator/antitoxin MqsA